MNTNDFERLFLAAKQYREQVLPNYGDDDELGAAQELDAALGHSGVLDGLTRAGRLRVQQLQATGERMSAGKEMGDGKWALWAATYGITKDLTALSYDGDKVEVEEVINRGIQNARTAAAIVKTGKKDSEYNQFGPLAYLVVVTQLEVGYVCV